jgi:CspA family cold shock protein
MVENKKYTGTVVWFNATIGLGFIAKDDGSGDLFCHWSNIVSEGFKTLKAGQVVSYELGENHRGPQAVCIVVIKDAQKKDEE